MRVMKQIKVAFAGMFAACLVAAACVCIAPSDAFAYDSEPVSLKATVLVDGNLPDEPETFEIVLEALDEGAPMPEGVEGSSCSIFVQGGASGAFGAIFYDKPCVWHYQVTQLPGANELGIYDTTVYNVTVSITNDENGNLEQTVAAHPNGSDQKTEIVFSNYYDEPLPDTGGLLPQTGDELMKLVVPLAVIVCVAVVACVFAVRRSKIQRAGHRR